MNRGAIAIIDALGFKGIWGKPERPDLSALNTLRAVARAVNKSEREASKQLKHFGHNLPPPWRRSAERAAFRVHFMSDTIVIAAWHEGSRVTAAVRAFARKQRVKAREVLAALDFVMLHFVCECVCQALKTAALAKRPLAYRGAVAVGNFQISKPYLIGPAVDEAAELMNTPDGAFVWLAPSASATKIVGYQNPETWKKMIAPTLMPLATGKQLHAPILSPFAFCRGKARRAAVRAGILRAMRSNKIDVIVKRQNTGRFLRILSERIDREEDLARRRKKARRTKAVRSGA